MLKHVLPVEMGPTGHAKNYLCNFLVFVRMPKDCLAKFYKRARGEIPQNKDLTSFQKIMDPQAPLPQFSWISQMKINL